MIQHERHRTDTQNGQLKWLSFLSIFTNSNCFEAFFALTNLTFILHSTKKKIRKLNYITIFQIVLHYDIYSEPLKPANRRLSNINNVCPSAIMTKNRCNQAYLIFQFLFIRNNSMNFSLRVGPCNFAPGI